MVPDDERVEVIYNHELQGTILTRDVRKMGLDITTKKIKATRFEMVLFRRAPSWEDKT